MDDPKLEIQIEDIGYWRMASATCTTFQSGRVFLAGDAAHRVPPTGGFEMNLGIQDAHNLAWRLAYVLKGTATSQLLEPYTSERRPVVETISNWSVGNAQRIFAIYKAVGEQNISELKRLLADQERHLNAPGLELGFSYVNQTASEPEIFIPQALVRRRAPHVIWNQKSLMESLHRKFAVLSTSKQEPIQPYLQEWIRKGRDCVEIIDSRLKEAPYSLADDECVIVRPDGHIAFRGIDPQAIDQPPFMMIPPA